MIRILFVLIAFLITPIAKSQVAIFPDSNSKWTYYHAQTGNYTSFGITNLDTVLEDGKIYHQVFGSNDTIYTANEYLGGIRIDTSTNRVYYKGNLTLQDTLVILYDFNLRVGDTLTRSKGYNVLSHPYVVTEIDTEIIGGINRKCMYLDCTTPSYPSHKIIQGIGNSIYIFCSYLDVVPGTSTRLTCFINNHQCVLFNSSSCDKCWLYTGLPLFGNSTIIEVTPNPTKNYLKLTITNILNLIDVKIRIYDSFGIEQTSKVSINRISQDTLLDVTSLDEGVFIILIYTTHGVTPLKFQKIL